MRLKTKRRLAGLLCFVICMSTDGGHLVTFLNALSDSGIIQDVSNLCSNLVNYAFAEDSLEDEGNDTTEEDSGPPEWYDPNITVSHTCTLNCNCPAADVMSGLVAAVNNCATSAQLTAAEEAIITATVTAITEAQVSIEEKIAALNTVLSTIESHLSEIKTDVDSIEQDTDKLVKDIAEILKDTYNIDLNVGYIYDAITGTDGTNDKLGHIEQVLGYNSTSDAINILNTLLKIKVHIKDEINDTGTVVSNLNDMLEYITKGTIDGITVGGSGEDATVTPGEVVIDPTTGKVEGSGATSEDKDANYGDVSMYRALQICAEYLSSLDAEIDVMQADLAYVAALLLQQDYQGKTMPKNISDIRWDTAILKGSLGFIKTDNIESNEVVYKTTLYDEIEYLEKIMGYGDTDENTLLEGRNVQYDLQYIKDELTHIDDDLHQMMHQYRVAHIYSMNNIFTNSLWRPYMSEVPYVEDFATVTGKFANVYSGYWNAAVTSISNPSGKHTKRAYEVLGYDAIVRSQGVVAIENVSLEDMSKQPIRDASGESGKHELYNTKGVPTHLMVSLVQNFMPETNITWLDAVTLLYKALDQNIYTYQSFMAVDETITPETSPTAQGLAGVTQFKGYNYYMFLNRDNTVQGTAENLKYNYVYWDKACNDGFVNINDRDNPITAAQFYVLAADMMQAFGEPEINQDEIKALLQVYGSEYPIQQGVTVADAWAYLKVRGCLDVEMGYASYVNRDDLLDVCMRIKDENSRVDYKNIQIVLDLADVLRDDGYYPVYNLPIADGTMEQSITVDYSKMPCYDYLLPKTSDTDLGEKGQAVLFTEADIESEVVPNAYANIKTIIIENNEYYVVSIPKDWKADSYLKFVTTDGSEGDSSIQFYKIPASCLGGGIFNRYSIDSSTKIAEISMSTNYYPFDYKSGDKNLIYFTDYSRAGEDKPAVELAKDATILERFKFAYDKATEPIKAYALPNLSLVAIPVMLDGPCGLRLPVGKDAIITTERQLVSTEQTSNNSNSTTNATQGSAELILETSHNGGTDRLALLKPSSAEHILENQIIMVDEFKDYFYKDINLYNYLNMFYKRNPTKLKVMASDLLRSHSDNIYPFFRCAFDSTKLLGMNDEQFMQGTSYSLFEYTSLIGTLATNHDIYISKSFSNGNEIDTKVSAANAIRMIEQGVFPLSAQLENWHSNDDGIGASEVVYTGLSDEWPTTIIPKSTTDMIYNYYNKNPEATFETSLSNGKLEVVASNIGLNGTPLEYAMEQIGLDTVAERTEQGNSNVTSEGVSVIKSGLTSDIASSTIMDRNEQMLISWTDMVDSGYVYSTELGGKPTMHDDTFYYFYTKNGLVKVSNVHSVIQIGSTIYDFYSSNPMVSSPVLVYQDVEQNNELYFDIRCVTGIINQQIVKDEGKYIEVSQSVGTGKFAVYTISSEGASNPSMDVEDIWVDNISGRSYKGYDDVYKSLFNAESFPVSIITKTIHDDNYSAKFVGAENNKVEEPTEEVSENVVTYYGDSTSVKMKRLALAQSFPTANWVTYISNKDTNNVTAKLYVYYPLQPFLENRTVSPNGEIVTLYKYGDEDNVESDVPEAPDIIQYSNIWNKIQTIDASFPDVELLKKMQQSYPDQMSKIQQGKYNEVPWYYLSTINSICSLVELSGKFYFSPEYVIREFDITNNTPSYGFEQSTDNKMYGNTPGAIYWLESVGFVYNIPKSNDFSMAMYLRGERILPIYEYTSNNIDSKIINCNFNSDYAVSVEGDTLTPTTVDLPYGLELSKAGMVTSHGVVYTVNVVTKAGSETNIPLSPKYINANADIPPYNLNKDIPNVKPMRFAPSGVYAYYGQDTVTKLKLSDITSNNTAVNKLYIGSNRVYIDNHIDNNVVIKYVSTEYKPITLSNDTTVYRVQRDTKHGDTYIIEQKDLSVGYGTAERYGEVTAQDGTYVDMPDFMVNLGLDTLLMSIDRGASMAILIAFQVLPIIGIILMTILVGLSFVSDNILVKKLADKFIDPVKILTLGGRTIETWSWKHVLFPCTIMYTAFALFLNGNIIRIIIKLAEWYGVIYKYLKFL